MKEVILTPEGYEKLAKEIEYLSTEKRREVAERIQVAREFGDIAENAEYDDAKNEQAMLEHQIAQLEERLVNARVIQKKDVAKDVVSIGSNVRLKDVDANETVEYHIVGSAEANPAEQKLSNESPVGKAIIGKKKGETVEVAAPRGRSKFKILDIKAASASRPRVSERLHRVAAAGRRMLAQDAPRALDTATSARIASCVADPARAAKRLRAEPVDLRGGAARTPRRGRATLVARRRRRRRS